MAVELAARVRPGQHQVEFRGVHIHTRQRPERRILSAVRVVLERLRCQQPIRIAPNTEVLVVAEVRIRQLPRASVRVRSTLGAEVDPAAVIPLPRLPLLLELEARAIPTPLAVAAPLERMVEQALPAVTAATVLMAILLSAERAEAAAARRLRLLLLAATEELVDVEAAEEAAAALG